HTFLYSFDDNITLMTSNVFGKQSVFQVYQSIFSHYSTIFADMLVLPPVLEAKTYNNVPLVCFPDNAKETKFLLKAIY
ncbi:uncharacterized protein F5891DRAFT_929675, partial [Suillus fuscotomentosus]